MMASSETAIGGGDVRFQKTLWTVILGSSTPEERRKAFGELVRLYWKPVYFYIRRRGSSVEDAKDLTQEFFSVGLEKDFLRSVSRSAGKFRTFLIAALNHFLSKRRRHDRAAKRGGGHVVSLDFSGVEGTIPARSDESPEAGFDRQWVVALIEESLARLREESGREGRLQEFDALAPVLTQGSRHYDAIAQSLGWTNQEVARRVFAYRTRLRALIEAQIRESVTSAGDFEEEVKAIFSIF